MSQFLQTVRETTRRLIEQIRKLMGHKCARTTQYHYLRSIEPDIEQIKGPLD